MSQNVSKPLPADVLKFLASKKFKLQQDFSNTRYNILKGTMPSYKEPVVIKLERGDQRLSLQQRNHVLWTRSIQHLVPANAPFRILPVLEDGFTPSDNHWFIMPYVDGSQFAEFDDKDHTTKVTRQEPQKLFPAIIALMRFIAKSPAKSALGYDARFGGVSRKDKLELLQAAIKMLRTSTPHIAELLQIINANYNHLGVTNSHSDFSDINILIDKQNRPVLIDSDLSQFNYKYYDVVEFYNRLYTRACSPELAVEFLEQYVKGVASRSRSLFYSNFLCLSALRAIGNFSEINSLSSSSSRRRKRLIYAKRYANDIVDYRIFAAGSS